MSLLDYGWHEPELDSAVPVELWATYHNMPSAQARRRGAALRTPKGRTLARVSEKRWCQGAMQGVLRVVDGEGNGTTYNYAGQGEGVEVDCSRWFPAHPAISKSRFVRAHGSFGDGVRGMQLIPYRSIAVDKRHIPYGAVVYIPSARGTPIRRPDGQTITHDGYFFAASTGGAIRKNHIDVFIGPAQENPFKFVQSTENAPFEAYWVQDPEIEHYLRSHHKVPKSVALLEHPAAARQL